MLPKKDEVIVYFYLWKINVVFPFTGANFIIPVIPVYYVMKRHLWITKQSNGKRREWTWKIIVSLDMQMGINKLNY